jgi:ATP-binding cassette, subfamily B (MDR/TAP), member 1
MAPELSEKEREMPEKSLEHPLSRPSTQDDSATSTISPPSAKGEKQSAQSAPDLSKIDSKVIVAQKESEKDPYQHLPDHEASILRRRKYYYSFPLFSIRRL